MSYLTRFIPFATLMVLALLAACSGGENPASAPAPTGLQAGKPTFVHLWNSP